MPFDSGYGIDFSWIMWLAIIGGIIGLAARVVIRLLLIRRRNQLTNPFNLINPIGSTNPMEALLGLTFQSYFNQYNNMQQDYLRLMSALQAAQAQSPSRRHSSHSARQPCRRRTIG